MREWGSGSAERIEKMSSTEHLRIPLKEILYLLYPLIELFLEVHVGCYASAKWTSFFVPHLSCVKDGEMACKSLGFRYTKYVKTCYNKKIFDALYVLDFRKKFLTNEIKNVVYLLRKRKY